MKIQYFFSLFLVLSGSLSASVSRNVHPPHPTVYSTTTTPPFLQKNDIPPRLEWDQNYGYCGETSFITAGLLYGQYCSQYKARALASPGVPQYENGSQLLIGDNDQSTAAMMHLTSIEWDTDSESDTDDFLAWIKQHVIAGYPVIFGVFTNEYLLYGDTDPNSGDPDYDHIVLAYGIGSNHSLTDTSFYPDDTLYFIDNGLWAAYRNPFYHFSYPFASFEADRPTANDPNGPIYSLNNDASNYGIVITGVTDLGGNTIPVRVSPSINYEIPEILEGAGKENPPPGSNEPPPPIPLTLTVTVTISDQTKAYHLYYYNSFANVPSSQFNAHASEAYQTYLIPANYGPTYVLTVDILSDEVAAFRAVPTTAP